MLGAFTLSIISTPEHSKYPSEQKTSKSHIYNDSGQKEEILQRLLVKVPVVGKQLMTHLPMTNDVLYLFLVLQSALRVIAMSCICPPCPPIRLKRKRPTLGYWDYYSYVQHPTNPFDLQDDEKRREYDNRLWLGTSTYQTLWPGNQTFELGVQTFL